MFNELVIKAEPQPLNYKLMEMYPEKLEMLDGCILGIETILSYALFNVGLERMVELLPGESKEILKKIVEDSM